MKILIADDDAVARVLVEELLRKWGFDVVAASDGVQAWRAFDHEDPPAVAILDWMMPEMDGLEVCRKLRASPRTVSTYILFLTVRGSKADVVRGFDAGADDYVSKPFDPEELRARVQVAARILELQRSLAGRVQELEEALARVNQLQGLLPICSYCKKIRDDKNYWRQVEIYITEHSQVHFSHGVCPDCYDLIVKPKIESLKAPGNLKGLGHDD